MKAIYLVIISGGLRMGQRTDSVYLHACVVLHFASHYRCGQW